MQIPCISDVMMMPSSNFLMNLKYLFLPSDFVLGFKYPFRKLSNILHHWSSRLLQIKILCKYLFVLSHRDVIANFFNSCYLDFPYFLSSRFYCLWIWLWYSDSAVSIYDVSENFQQRLTPEFTLPSWNIEKRNWN